MIGVGAASPCGQRKRSSSLSSEVNPGVSTDPNGYTCDGERWWGSNYGTTTAGAAGAVDVLAPTILPTTDRLGSAGYTFKFVPFVALPGADGRPAETQEAKGKGESAWKELLGKLDVWQTNQGR